MIAASILFLVLAANIAHAQPIAPQAASAPATFTTSLNKKSSVAGQQLPSSAVLTTTSKPPSAPAPVSVTTTPALDVTLDTVEKFLKVLAYLVGAAWVYFNYIRGRTYKARLEVKLSGVRLEPNSLSLAKITAQVKNAGLSKCELLDRGSGLRLQGYDATKQVDHWTSLGTYTMLTKNNQWIEPGVTIEEQVLLPIDSGKYAAFRVELILNSKDVRWKMAAIF